MVIDLLELVVALDVVFIWLYINYKAATFCGWRYEDRAIKCDEYL